MKFGNELAEGKQSIPGAPVVFRRRSGSGPIGLIGQEGEPVPAGYELLSGATPESAASIPAPGGAEDVRVAYTPATQALVDELRQRHFPRAAAHPA
jgi:hypothetical protein